MQRIEEPRIVIAWRYCDGDHLRYVNALKQLGLIDDYEISQDGREVLLISYRDKLAITPCDIADMFKSTLGFVPEELIEETWHEIFTDLRKGRIKEYSNDVVVIEAEP